MHIAYTDKVFHDTSSSIHLHKEFWPSVSLYCHIALLTEAFLDYQKDIFEEFLSDLVESLSDEDVAFTTVKRDFERLLQNLNEKLQVFASKIKDSSRFEIKGVIQIIVGWEYLASLIGSVGMIILRKEKLHYMISNQLPATSLIDQFSEFIEGEVRPQDTVLVFGIPVDSFLDKDDIDTILQMSVSEEKVLLDAFREILQVRLSEKELSFMLQYHIDSGVTLAQKKIKSTLQWPLKKVGQLVGGLERFQALTAYILIGVVVLILVYRLIQSFQQANEATFVNTEGGVVMDVTVEDIQKDIALFKKIDPSSDQKIKKYNEIVAQLDILQENNRRTYDVAELRKILETEYYKGFNIVLANTDAFFKEPVYVFTQQEQNTFGTPQQVFYRDSLYVAGNEGVLLGAINDQMRGTLVSAGLDRTLQKCSFNLLKNGVYCKTDDNQLFNIVKAGVQPVSTTEGIFPTNVQDVGTFGSSNMYFLTSDPTLAWNNAYIVRYSNQLGSQEQFGEGTEYTLAESENGYAFASSGFSSFAIDGTFLLWSPTSRSIYQLRRADASTTLQFREIALEGWDTVEPYSPSTKVLAFAESRYVYLFDPQNQTFTVYRSSPYKTNDGSNTSYKLTYFFRIKFALEDLEVRDVFVEEGERSNLYLLTDSGVYKMNLYEYIEQFFAKEAAE